MSYEAPKTPSPHFWPKSKFAEITVCSDSNSHSIQLTVVKFAQMFHFNAFSPPAKAKCVIFTYVFHMHNFIIFNTIKTYFFKIVNKPNKMMKCHTLNYFVTRINIYRAILDKIYPNIYQTYSIIIWYVTSGAEKSEYSW